jgi:hypothetical protein
MTPRRPNRRVGGTAKSCGASGGEPTVVDILPVQFIPIGTIIPVGKIVSSDIFVSLRHKDTLERWA